ncbi:hypothetical protein Tco_1184722 [Tanacetum coccineum]
MSEGTGTAQGKDKREGAVNKKGHKEWGHNKREYGNSVFETGFTDTSYRRRTPEEMASSNGFLLLLSFDLDFLWLSILLRSILDDLRALDFVRELAKNIIDDLYYEFVPSLVYHTHGFIRLGNFFFPWTHQLMIVNIDLKSISSESNHSNLEVGQIVINLGRWVRFFTGAPQEEGQITSSGWPFVSAVPYQMTYPAASLTLDSERPDRFPVYCSVGVVIIEILGTFFINNFLNSTQVAIEKTLISSLKTSGIEVTKKLLLTFDVDRDIWYHCAACAQELPLTLS